MRRIRSCLHEWNLKIGVALILFWFSAPALAQQTITDINRRVVNQSGNLGTLLTALIAVLGLYMVGRGLQKAFAARDNPQDGRWAGVPMIIAGSLMLVIIVIATFVSRTILDADPDPAGLGSVFR